MTPSHRGQKGSGSTGGGRRGGGRGGQGDQRTVRAAEGSSVPLRLISYMRVDELAEGDDNQRAMMRTSVRLEQVFVDALEELRNERGLTSWTQLVALAQDAYPDLNVTAALRVMAITHCRQKIESCSDKAD